MRPGEAEATTGGSGVRPAGSRSNCRRIGGAARRKKKQLPEDGGCGPVEADGAARGSGMWPVGAEATARRLGMCA